VGSQLNTEMSQFFRITLRLRYDYVMIT